METTAPAELSRREQKKLETHQRILTTSVELFVAQGYDGTTVDEISAAAGISKPTFFNYFPSKQSVLTTLIDHTDQSIIDNIRTSSNLDVSASEQLRCLFERAGQIILANASLAKILITHGLQSYQSQEIYPPVEKMRAFMTTLLEHGRNNGEFDKSEVLDCQFYLVYGMYFHTIADWAYNDKLDLPARMKTGVEFVIRKLASS